MGMPMKIEVESARKRIRTEAEHGALRIAALVGVPSFL
jgi:hypothetical protein